MKNIQCPECNSFKTASLSPRYLARVIGGTSLFVGFGLAIFLIGIPFIFLGIALVLISFVLPSSKKMRCRNCAFVWMAG